MNEKKVARTSGRREKNNGRAGIRISPGLVLRESEPLLIDNGIVRRPASLLELVLFLEGCEA